MAEKDQVESNLTPDKMLSGSKFYSNEMKMEVVPYTIALQALTLEKSANVINDIGEHLAQLANIEEELAEVLNKIK